MNWKTKLAELAPFAVVHAEPGDRVFVTAEGWFGTRTTVQRVRVSPHNGSVLYVMANGQWLDQTEFKKAP